MTNQEKGPQLEDLLDLLSGGGARYCALATSDNPAARLEAAHVRLRAALAGKPDPHQQLEAPPAPGGADAAS